MPTAIKFNSSGAGNGFPFCFRELAVKPVNGSLGMTSSAYNTQYGDFSRINSSIGFSRGKSDPKDFANLYWNLYSFTVSASVSYTYTVNGSTRTESGSVSNIQMNRSSNQEPRERVCGTGLVAYESTFTKDQESRISFGPIYYFENGDGSKEYYLSFDASIRVAADGFFPDADLFYSRNFNWLSSSGDEGFESVWEGVITIDGIQLDMIYIFFDIFGGDPVTAEMSITGTTFYTY